MEEENLLDEPKSDELFQKLRDWQHQQHQRLIEQQQQQRLMLLQQQKQLLSRINTDCVLETPLEDNGTSPDQESNNQVLHSSKGVNNPTYRVDDVPLKKPRSIRTFQQILENSLTKKELPNGNPSEQQKTKFPFLKRGQGISRFGVVSKPAKKLSSHKSVGKENQMAVAVQQSANVNTLGLKSCKNSQICSQPEEVTSETETAADTDCHQLVSLQPAGNFNESNTKDREVNSSRSGEDLAVFELLERFATINASFSSSSSLIGQLIDRGVTHLPSPSKVMDFLSHKQHLDIAEEEPTPKLLRTNKHVHFSDSLDESPVSAKPESYQSPFISNTVGSANQQIDDTDPEPEQSNFDETPPSPIGFPDFKKLFRSNLSEKPNSLSNPISMLNDEAPLKEDARMMYQGSLLTSRLTTLEREIAMHRRETESLRKSRKDHEEAKLKLDQEQEKFRRFTENEKRRLQLLYSEEQKRLRSEQLKEASVVKGNPNEVEKLKDELKRVQEEHRIKEGKWRSNQTKMQEKVRLLEQRNRELSESLNQVSHEEQNLRRRLNASLRPGAVCTKSRLLTEKNENQPTPLERNEAAESIPESTAVSPKSSTKIPPESNEVPSSRIPSTKTLHVDSISKDHSAVSAEISQTLLPDGTKLVIYPNGNRKEIWPNGKGIQVIYYNGDIKQKLSDGSIIYTYADSGTKHTTKSDGTEILEFRSGQIETTYPDGRSQVQYSGGVLKMKYPDGREEAQWPDGTKLWTDGKGHGVMTFQNGMREIYTPICKRREYPDGTVKTVYEDGRSETRYGNGRIRVKDKDGVVITDTGEVQTTKQSLS